MKKMHFAYCAIGIVFAAILLGALGVSTSTLGIGAVALACPLMMLGMMWMMRSHGEPDHEHHQLDHHPAEHDRAA